MRAKATSTTLSWGEMQRRSRHMYKHLYERDATAAVMAWTYGWDDIISAYVSKRDYRAVQSLLEAFTRLHTAHTTWKRQAVMRVLHLFLPKDSVAREHVPLRPPPSSHRELDAGRAALQGRAPPRAGTFDADVDAFVAAHTTTDDKTSGALQGEETRRRLMLASDPHAFLAAVDRATEHERTPIDVLSVPRGFPGLVLSEHDQELLAQNLTAGLLRAFLCFGQRRTDQLYFRGDGKDLDLWSKDARAKRWKALENTFVSVSHDKEVMETFINQKSGCCKFWVFASECYVLDVRRVNERVPRQKRYEEVHLNSELENEQLLAPGHRFVPIESLQEKQTLVLDRWMREARLHGVSYREGNAPWHVLNDTGMEYATFGDVAFQMQPRASAASLGDLFFLDCQLVTKYKQAWFRDLSDVFFVNATFDSDLFHRVLLRKPSLLAAVQTWRAVPAHPTRAAPEPLLVD
jgi:hypothetical protein